MDAIRLVRRPLSLAPWIWATAFLALIPSFGTIYSLLGAGSFYDANIQRDPSLSADAQKLRDGVTTAINRPRQAPSWRTTRGRFELDPTSLTVAAVRHTTDGRLLIDIRGTYRRAEGRTVVGQVVFSEWLRVATFGEETFVNPPSGGPPLAGYGVDLSDFDGNPPRSEVSSPRPR